MKKAMAKKTSGNGGAPFGVPPPQHNLRVATEKAFRELRGQSDEQLDWLGAKRSGRVLQLSVLDDVLEIDVEGEVVRIGGGVEVGAPWGILVLHYLGIRSCPERLTPEITFADLSSARTYSTVYDHRVIGRLCATAGRDAESLSSAADKLGATTAEGGDLSFDFALFPRLQVRLIWYAGDEEFSPSATLLIPRNIESFFCVEDIVVLSERLVARLGGRGF